MRALLALIVGIFSFVLIDLNILRKLRISSKNVVSITDEFEDKKTKNKKRRKSYKNRKYKKRKKFKNKHYKLKDTKSKDARYSNHQKLRRMYRNM